MSEEQAIETEDAIDTNEDAIESTEANEEVEIVVEGEEQPSSKPQVPIGLRKRFNKLNGKIDAANSEAEEARRRAEMLEEENRLLRLNAQQDKPATRPDEDDFDSNKEYLAALDDYERTRIAEIAKEQAAEIVKANQSSTVNQDVELEGKLSKHYERATSLKMPSYEDLEDKAIDALGNDLAKVIMVNTTNSHLIMAHLGANVGKAYELAELVKTNPVQALVQAVELGNKLSVKPKHSSAPDPDALLNGGLKPNDERGPVGAKYE